MPVPIPKYIYIHMMHVITMKKRGHVFEQGQAGVHGRLAGRKGKGNWYNYIIISEMKQTKISFCSNNTLHYHNNCKMI